MPPPHLHPRSRMTSSLFATTVFASFFVVILPHILPCPAPRVALADGQMPQTSPDGTPRRRRRRRPQDEVMAGRAPVPTDGAVVPLQVERDADGMARFAMVNPGEENASSRRNGAETVAFSSSPRRNARECPVPKPGGVVGELLGFKSSSSSSSSGSGQPKPSQAPHAPSLEK
ncbi:hypothetical protein SCUCBS95973_002032 [Sporothrix curviconia]|uniref:Alpha-1,3-mannosyltransferase n=1 Tax=Sporothrix curviconia TaxID=1260050 RepID=A0ABP0B3N1_9PEZI